MIMTDRGKKLAIVTALTAARLPLVLLFFVGALVYELPAWNGSYVLFAVTFMALILSSLTDLFDGYYARKWDVVTTFGAHVDPLMDKFFYLASLPLLVFVAAHNGHWPHATILLVLTLLFLARDQWVTFLRSIGAIYNVSGGAHWVGKLRTASNFPIICAIYYFECAPDAIQFLPLWLIYVAEAYALVLTLYSLWIYTANYWPYLRKATEPEENHPTD
jgi:CDP-diacylglycerol--glycerol-3-phosphate 3-phosphatidyltransferase